MAEKLTHHNDTPQDDGTGLRGGTQTGGHPAPVHVGGVPGGNLVSGTGASPDHVSPTPERHGTRTDSRDDPEAIFEGSRHQSQSVAKQFARDDANANTQAQTPHGAGEPRYHQIHADPTKAPGSQGDNEPTAPATRGESTGEPH